MARQKQVMVQTRDGVKNILDVEVPDMWHLYEAFSMMAEGKTPMRLNKPFCAHWASMVYKTWMLTHDLKRHIEKPLMPELAKVKLKVKMPRKQWKVCGTETKATAKVEGFVPPVTKPKRGRPAKNAK